MKLYNEMTLELLMQLATKAFIEGTKDGCGVTGTSITVLYTVCKAPLSICSVDAFGVYDPDGSDLYTLSEYGKKWVIVDKGNDDPIDVIDKIWKQSGVDLAAQAAEFAYEYGEIGDAVRVESAAILDGVMFFAQADPDYPQRNGLHKANNWSNIRTPDKWGLSHDAYKMAVKMLEEAIEDAKIWEEAYEKWEASWINGPF